MKSVRHTDLKLSYKQFGNGNSIYLTFHGHGKDHSDFEPFAQILKATVYSFDLFGHGQSQIPSERLHESPLRTEEFETLLKLFLAQENISEFAVIGYSLGGKMALNTFLLFPSQTRHILLLAPDGLKNITWYGKTSQKKLLRRWYKHVVEKPKFFFSLVRSARFLRLIPKNLFRFLDYQFATRERRFLAFQTWGFYRNAFPNPNNIQKTLTKHPINVKVVVGKYDSVIKPVFAYNFKEKYHAELEVVELEIGHDFFKEKNLDLVQKELDKTPYL